MLEYAILGFQDIFEVLSHWNKAPLADASPALHVVLIIRHKGDSWYENGRNS